MEPVGRELTPKNSNSMPQYEPLKTDADQPRKLPKISCQQWIRLGIVWLCCTTAAGLIPGQALFAKMFADAGVYGELCKSGELPCATELATLNLMLGMGVSLVMLSQLPVGLIFDLYGGRVVGAVGAVIVGCGLTLTSITIYSSLNGTDVQSNWLIPIAAIVTDFGSVMNSYCFFSLVWHYPGCTNLILSLSGATYQVSAVLPIILRKLMDVTGMGLDVAMFCFAILVFATVPIILRVTPTQQDYYDRATEVLGVPLPKPKQTFEPCSKVYKGWIAVRIDIWDHLWLMSSFAFSACFAAMYNSMSSAYGVHLFGYKEAGDQLAQMQVVATAIVGAICAPGVARLSDYLGLQLFSWILLSFVLFPTALFFIAQWWAAWATTFGLLLFITMNTLFANRYFLHYAPPNRVGIYSGVFTMLYIIVQMPFQIGCYSYIMTQPENDRYFVPYLGMGILSLVSLVAFNIRFCFVHEGRGVPRYPNMLPEDEMELVAIFGAMTIQEASVILGMDKEALFKKLADPDPETLMELVMMVDTSKVDEQLAERSPEDMIKMFEMQEKLEADYEEEEEAAPEPAKVDADGFTAMRPGNPPEGTPLVADVEAPVEISKIDNAQALGKELCRVLKDTDASARKAKLVEVGKVEDEMRWRALGECLDTLVFAGEKDACENFLLEIDIEDQWKAMTGMEDWLEEKRSKEMEKKFNKLVPAKAFAALMKKRPELKGLVSRLVKREVKRSISRATSRKKKQ